ncbi:hypothetical protein [Methylobacterium haplocladii]|uniref:Cytochrome c domain-containing protein n=1 Tax=Methylobacterium haplocladii TaxID=1176176 RepID=A0A512IKZ9_9HYPH|nr:hypothetical protein [Methylobacterium haplocladii]GEO98355.1 hypothetical protein MHA02_07430 [Methylobacterium haplocladii]GJD82983.1 hypothetical protein HPGCJGGD_0845 [Methylobacterium haplocladii]GLS58748.1 hypothetical protein GCM10007887_14130 [Methylobacterium haplocladii]
MTRSRHGFLLAAQTIVMLATSIGFGATQAAATTDEVRNKLARKDCVRGKFANYYREGKGGDPAPEYRGRVFKLSQNYPDQLPPAEQLPWQAIDFKDGAPVDPRAYLQALLDYGLEGNVDVDFYVEDNKVRKWYGMPWMDWNTEVASDWPGTDGREFVHGFTHEFDSSGNTLSTLQRDFVDTWSGAYFNDRAAFGIGQVYCNPDDPKPGALNPDPTALNTFPDGAFIIKLLFSTVTEDQLPTVKNALEWKADVFVNDDPRWRNAGPLERFKRAVGTIRMIQIDVSVRDARSTTGWLLGTFGYDGNAKGDTPWKRMVPLGLQWGNSPKATFAETCTGPNGPCDQSKLTEQWINPQALKELTTAPLNFNHLGYGGRLAGPVDNAKASCMGCHQTAGFPNVAILPEFSANGTLLGLDAERQPQTEQSLRMMYQANVVSGVVFSDTQLYSSDSSLQLSMSLQNFVSLRCAARQPGAAAPQETPSLCTQLARWQVLQRKSIDAVSTFGTPGPDGGPLPTP